MLYDWLKVAKALDPECWTKGVQGDLLGGLQEGD